MKKQAYTDRHWGAGWPSLGDLEPVFLSPEHRGIFFRGGHDGASLIIDGLCETEEFASEDARVKVSFYITMNPVHGAYLLYARWDGRVQRGDAWHSKGDLSRLRKWVTTLHGTPVPIGLFVPFEQAWSAVKEFIETDGALPTSIEWVSGDDLSDEVFPNPYLYAKAKAAGQAPG